MPNPPITPAPSTEMLARAWHALSDEGFEGIPFNGEGCQCRNFAPLLQQVFDLLAGEPVTEPDGLGAVVVNPFTDSVWVRGAHPALPWQDPDAAAPVEWSDPTSEDWFTWGDLPRPLVVQSPGWAPPPASEPRRRLLEPTGLGAVIIDNAGEAWVRVNDGGHPWLKVNSETAQVESWQDLAHPVRLRASGWNR